MSRIRDLDGGDSSLFIPYCLSRHDACSDVSPPLGEVASCDGERMVARFADPICADV